MQIRLALAALLTTALLAAARPALAALMLAALLAWVLGLLTGLLLTALLMLWILVLRHSVLHEASPARIS